MDWRNLTAEAVFTQKDKDGNRYLTQFIRDYKKVYPGDAIDISCNRCLKNYFTKYIKYLNNMKNPKNTTTKARLKHMYQGIQLKFGAKKHINNANMTQEDAVALLTKHPKGAGLFDVLPEVAEKKDKDLTKAELNAKYPGLKKGTKKEMLAEIAEREAASKE